MISGDSASSKIRPPVLLPALVEAPGAISHLRKTCLRIEGKRGPKFISIHGDRIESLENEPKLENAEKLTLKESNEPVSRMKPMEPMEPMKPMKFFLIRSGRLIEAPTHVEKLARMPWDLVLQLWQGRRLRQRKELPRGLVRDLY